MALITQDQGYKKLKSWLPSWFFHEEGLNEATLQAIAKLYEALGDEIDAHWRETYICSSTAPVMDEHGRERNVYRITNEKNVDFCIRIQNLINKSNCPAIKALVDSFLVNGESIIVEHWNGGAFFTRESFLNRGAITFEDYINQFTIIVDNQVHAPFSFYTREYFCTREDFIGTNESPISLFELIVAAVNNAKAAGVLYRIIERFTV